MPSAASPTAELRDHPARPRFLRELSAVVVGVAAQVGAYIDLFGKVGILFYGLLSLPRHPLRRAAPTVRAFCQARELPYTCQPLGSTLDTVLRDHCLPRRELDLE